MPCVWKAPLRNPLQVNIMKIDNIPDYIDPSLNLEQIRDECHELIQKRAYVSAGAAIVPIPFLTWS